MPADWGVLPESQKLQAMWGCSLTVGMEALCWSPLRGLSPGELTFLDRVRHDTMLICARFGLATIQSQDLAAEREFREAAMRFEKDRKRREKG